jgi:hypothetical protein
MNSRIAAAAVMVTAFGAATPSAGAAPPPATPAAGAAAATFQHTYPGATKLCTRIAKGAGPVKLRPSAAQVLADCAALETSFNAATAAKTAALAPIDASLAADRTAERASCPRTITTTVQQAACQLVRHTDRPAIKTLAIQRLSVVASYLAAVDANRKAFWQAIHALPGGANIRL